LKIRSSELKSRKQICRICSRRKKPFESIYEGIKRDHRKTKVELTYEEFLIFTQTQNCYYCDKKINWVPYGTIKGKFISRAYNLDRLDNNIGYEKNNLVVSCIFCDKLRSNNFTSEEFKIIGQALKIIYRQRKKSSCGS